MTIKETIAKSILRKQKHLDSWFLSCCGMNLYRGCTHDCVYCDGRAEGYYVEGEFGEEVAVKINAIDLLRRELDPKRRRTPLKGGLVMVGGGVGDSYQPVEAERQLTRKALELLAEFRLPAHVLTKSTLVERDRDLLLQIHQQRRACVSMSFSSVDDAISRIVEQGVPSPTERLKTLERLKRTGLICGMFLMPVIPFITDTPQMIDAAFRCAADIGLDYVVFGGMTLKEGKQKVRVYEMLRQHFPDRLPAYDMIYPGHQYGAAIPDYYHALYQTIVAIARQYNIPKRMPAALIRDLITPTELVVLILEQLDYLVKLQGQEKSPYSYAAHSIAAMREPLPTLRGTLRTIKGVGAVTEKIIQEILDTGTSQYYERLL